MTHDYKRQGTTTPLAAFNVLEDKVIRRRMQRHTHQEFIRFLDVVENQVPADKQVHVVLDNYATHKHPRSSSGLGVTSASHPLHAHSASGTNAVEGFFAKLTAVAFVAGMAPLTECLTQNEALRISTTVAFQEEF